MAGAKRWEAAQFGAGTLIVLTMQLTAQEYLQGQVQGVTGVCLGCKGRIPTPLMPARIFPLLRVWTELKGGIGRAECLARVSCCEKPSILWQEDMMWQRLHHHSSLWGLSSTYSEPEATAATDPVIHVILFYLTIAGVFVRTQLRRSWGKTKTI